MTRDDLLEFIRERAIGAVEPLPCHYVECDDDDFEHPACADFCRECGEAAVQDYKEARRVASQDDSDEDADDDRGIYLGGGYGEEKDSTPFCEVCGVRLDCSLTEYGVEQELEHFERYQPRYNDAESWAELERALEGLKEDNACWKWVAKRVKKAQAEGRKLVAHAAKMAAQPGMAAARSGLVTVLAARAAQQAHKPSFRLWEEMLEYVATPRGDRDSSKWRARGRRLRREAERFLGNFGYEWGGWECFKAPYGEYWWPYVVQIEQHQLWQTATFIEGQVAPRTRCGSTTARRPPSRRRHDRGGQRPMVRSRSRFVENPYSRDANPYPEGSADHEAWDLGFISRWRP